MSMKNTRGKTICLLVLGITVCALVGCPSVDDLTTRLYAKQAYQGCFVPTDDADVYNLYLWDVEAEGVWFTDRPDRDAGTEPWWMLPATVWNAVFKGQEPAGGIGYRLEDGVWELIPAHFMDAGFNILGGSTWKVRLAVAPPQGALTGVTVYLDDKGLSETAEGDTGVYLYAAADTRFESLGTSGQYRLVLDAGLDELMLVETPPGDGHALERTDLFIEHTWPLYFADDLPNAVVTIEGADGVQNPVVVVLSEPAWDAENSTLTFLAEVLLGDAERARGPATLFIDDWDDSIDDRMYRVVVNHEEQYSIWPADRELPLGWASEGFQGTKQDCLAHIEVIWTDMRPLSLRRKMEEAAQQYE